MKNRGFTLVEMLAVVLLLGLLTLLIVPKVLEQKEQKEKQISEAEKKILYADASEYVRSKPDVYEIQESNIFCIPVNTLISEDRISMDASNFKDKIIKIVVDENNNFKYNVVSNCSEGKVPTNP